MIKCVSEILEERLKEIEGKNLKIAQEGFIESKFEIQKAKCGIELDVLSIESSNNYIRINLNQVNKMQEKEDEIHLYLDDDTKIIIK